jgi:hypothetical protein
MRLPATRVADFVLINSKESQRWRDGRVAEGARLESVFTAR